MKKETIFFLNNWHLKKFYFPKKLKFNKKKNEYSNASQYLIVIKYDQTR